MRFRFIKEHRRSFEVGLMCSVLDVSSSGFYAWLRRPESGRAQETRRLLADIRAVHRKSRGSYGSPRVHVGLRRRFGWECGKNRVARLMREHGVVAKRRRRFRRTTQSDHNLPVAPNLVEQNFSAERPNELWLSDITYIWTAEGWLYLAAIEDVFSRKVVGYSMSPSLSATIVCNALDMALGTGFFERI